MGVMGRVDREAVRALVERTCAEQGLPVTVGSPAVVEQVSALLGRGIATSASKRRAPSHSPDRLRALGVDVPSAHLAGVDDHVIEDCLDDGALPVEVEGGPLAS